VGQLLKAVEDALVECNAQVPITGQCGMQYARGVTLPDCIRSLCCARHSRAVPHMWCCEPSNST